MRVCTDARGLLRACSEDATGRPLGLDLDHQSREVIFGSRIAGAKIRAEAARKRAAEAAREADRAEAEALVDPDGGLRRASAAVANDRAMPQRRLPPSQMPPAPHRGQHSARARPPAGVTRRSGSLRRR